MPLRDHFRPPLAGSFPWDSLHGGWPMKIVEAPNRRLPPRFIAAPHVHLGSSIEGDATPPTFAASCRWARGGDARVLEAWAHPMEIGREIPTLPLWLAADLAVPLELEPSYEEACRALRIP